MSEDKHQVMDEFITANEEIDVNAIMDSIRRKIQDKKDAGILKQKEIDEIVEMELLPLPDFLEIPNVYEPHLYPEHKGEDFNPIHVEPEIEAGAVKKIMAKFRSVLSPITRFMMRPFLTDQTNRVVELHNANKQDIHNLKQLIPVILQSKEYIKLLHNTINNMIVETSKNQIEKELLKTKIKVLEDKIEFLENRERAIEKKLYQE